MKWVIYNIAEQLKEIGFSEDNCIYHYKVSPETGKHTSVPTFEGKHPFGANHNHLPTRVSAPLYDDVIEWLIHKHNIHLYAYPIWNESGYVYSANIYRITDKVEHYSLGETPLKDLFLPSLFDSRCEALDAGILKAIEVIKQKK